MNDAFDIRDLETAANGDHEFIEMMIRKFIHNAQILSDLLTKNLQSGNWDEIGEKAHKAIPSFRYFKLDQLAGLLENIEDLALWEKEYKLLPDRVRQVLIYIEEVISEAEALLSGKIN